MKKNFIKKICFLLPSLRLMKKTEGSGSGYISQIHASADPEPDPHQNVMDPLKRGPSLFISEGGR
jgi:hypothetical protein